MIIKVHMVLAVKIHVWLSALWRFDCFAWSIDLIQQSVLLLTPIWVTSFDFQLLLGAGGSAVVTLLLITDIRVALEHLVVFVFTYNTNNQIPPLLWGILCIVLLLPEKALIMIDLGATSMLVAFSCVEARFIHHLVEARWVECFISYDGCRLDLTWWVVENFLYYLV